LAWAVLSELGNIDTNGYYGGEAARQFVREEASHFDFDLDRFVVLVRLVGWI
jgi:hypothetical protein